MKFLLFDMDDVLLKPGAYHQALRETVRLVAASLGYSELSLSQADIQAFEAAGVYSEWDTTAICAVLMLAAAWQYDPAIQLPNTIMVEPGVRLPVQPPEFSSFARRLGGPELQELRPLQRAERLLLDGQHGFTPDQSEGIRHILHTARAADGSLTHCTFQELVLGSDVYAQAYQRPAVLNAQSYLQRYDVPLVPAETVGSIRRWLKNPTHSAAIFTSRPSRPLPGVFSTPEAEMGAALVGLEELPIIGLGSLLWLSQQRQAGAQAFVKPSPVHVLSALLLALGYPPLTCLQEAATLALDGSASEFWKNLEGAEIAVFDDSPAGLGSAASARDCLASAGISIDLQVFGIAGDSQKIAALQSLGAKTCPDLTAALKLLAFNPEA
jgi:phosphoglycolate phosphatase-like HAD superfamily hydrolase